MKIYHFLFIHSLLLSSHLLAQTKNTIDCLFSTNDNDPLIAELQPRGKCAYDKDGKIFISQTSLSKLVFNEHNLAKVLAIPHGWLFVKKDGSTIPTLTYDNGADYFIEGLARYTSQKGIGYIDETGKTVIKAQFEFAYPFENGYAVVCKGAEVQVDGDYSFLKGGLWGCINKKGKIIHPIEFSEDELLEKVKLLRETNKKLVK